MAGKKEWFIPDGFMNHTSNGDFVSHEAICVLNMQQEEAHVQLTFYFEDRDPLTGFVVPVAGQRTNHIRLDRIVGPQGEKVPYDTPYAVYVKSDLPIIVQHSRMDVSQPAMALMTTIAFSED